MLVSDDYFTSWIRSEFVFFLSFHLRKFNCYHGGANGTHVAIEEPDKERTIPDQDEDELWCKTESIMRSQKSKVVEALENAGIVAEGGIDNNGDEEELWRVVEGKTGISVDAV